MLRILFTGGGTGGHIYPLVAVIEELKKISNQRGVDLRLRYFGAAGNYQYLLERSGARISSIISSKWRRYFDLKNFIDIPLFLISILQALWKIFWFMPDVLFSKGGPAALPVVLSCRFYKIPVIVHESDSIPGLSNQISARYAQRIAISFTSASQYFSKKEIIALVGNPIRASLLEGPILTQAGAKRIFGFNPEIPLIFVMGGSQGSKTINNFFLDIALELIEDFQVIHQTGQNNFDEFTNMLNLTTREVKETKKSRYKPVAYLGEDLKDALTGADVVISRAGSGSIFEIAALGKPSILIPLSGAANNHQVLNAYDYAKEGSAVVIEENNLKPNLVLTQLRGMVSSSGRLSQMSEAAKKFAKPGAAKTIAEEIIKIGERGI